jgi:3-deoxy-7-phosphoheptulonate synthase
LEEGSQPVSKSRKNLRYGVSVTDACIDWKATENLLRAAAESESKVRGNLRVAVK